MLLMIQSIFSYLNKETNHQIILFFLPVHIFNNRLFLVCVQEDENHGMVQQYKRLTFLFHKRTKSAMVKCKLHPGLKQQITLVTELRLFANICIARMLTQS